MISILLAVICVWSCANPTATVKSVWLPEAITWKSSDTGLKEIDSVREESYTEVLIFFDDRLAYGDASLFKFHEGDSIAVAYEAGEMLLSVKDCLPVENTDHGKVIVTNKYSMEFIDEHRLKFGDKIFERSEKFYTKSKSDLDNEIINHCPN